MGILEEKGVQVDQPGTQNHASRSIPDFFRGITAGQERPSIRFVNDCDWSHLFEENINIHIVRSMNEL